MELPTIKPEWRTPTVVELCQSMREAQDFSALPILADALQDADCGDEKLLARLRHGRHSYAEAAAVVACVYSAESADAADWLVSFGKDGNGPSYEPLFNAATGNHHLNTDPDQPSYVYSEIPEWDESYLHFNGSDAHGEIPAEFWGKVELVAGKVVRERPSHFSCSC